MTRIELNGVSLSFRLTPPGGLSIKDWVINGFRAPPGCTIVVDALKNLTLSINDGDRLGIVGHNGAGKSTLLKLLAGVYRPTEGTAHIRGKVCSLFDLALGFEWEANGWENIKFRGYLQRETPQSIRAKTQEIAEFSELGEALERPIKYYSSGMLVRLAFAIATAIDPEILLLDEILAAGDIAFQKKAKKRIQELINRARVMVLVTHDLASLVNLCNRAVWLEKGQVRMLGEPMAVAQAYSASMGRTFSESDVTYANSE